MKHEEEGEGAEFDGSTPKKRNCTDGPIRSVSAKGKVSFGPFREVDASSIKLAGWPCQRCRKPVRVLRVVVPYLVERLSFHSCKCATVCTWEAESQPTAGVGM
jgi:hypothetical protein